MEPCSDSTCLVKGKRESSHGCGPVHQFPSGCEMEPSSFICPTCAPSCPVTLGSNSHSKRPDLSSKQLHRILACLVSAGFPRDEGGHEEELSNGGDRELSPVIEWLPVGFRYWVAFLEHAVEVTLGHEASCLAPWTGIWRYTKFALSLLWVSWHQAGSAPGMQREVTHTTCKTIFLLFLSSKAASRGGREEGTNT